MANHNDDTTGWEYYYSKDDGIDVSTPTQVTLAAETASTTDTETADFNSAVEKTNTYVADGTVYLKKPNGVSCSSNDECAGNLCLTTCDSLPAVGESWQGGIVFFVSDNLILISKTNDNAMTTRLLAITSCTNDTTNGYLDWYLPSKDQLNILYGKKGDVGGFADFYYWSSTSAGSNSTWYQYFKDGTQGKSSGDPSLYVRCIRSFSY